MGPKETKRNKVKQIQTERNKTEGIRTKKLIATKWSERQDMKRTEWNTTERSVLKTKRNGTKCKEKTKTNWIKKTKENETSRVKQNENRTEKKQTRANRNNSKITEQQIES